MRELLNVFACFWNMFKDVMMGKDIAVMLEEARNYVQSYANTPYERTAEGLTELLCHEFGSLRYRKDNLSMYAEIFNAGWKFFTGHQKSSPEEIVNDASVIAQHYADSDYADFARTLILPLPLVPCMGIMAAAFFVPVSYENFFTSIIV